MQRPTKILIIRRDNIGDLACTTPAIEALHRRFPSAEIGVLVNSYNAEVLRGNPSVNQLFVYQKLKHAASPLGKLKAVLLRLHLIVQLRCWKPDVTILAKASYDRHGLNFARWIGAKDVVGFAPALMGQARNLPDVCINPSKLDGMHEVEAVNLLLAPLGIIDALGPLRVFPSAEAVSKIDSCISDGLPRIALHISARELERRWGSEKFVALSRHILDAQPKAQILLFWSPGKIDDPHHPGDDESADRIVQDVQSDRLIPMPTKTLSELVAGLSVCDLFIGADGGAMHLAAGLNLKVLALFENQPGKLSHWYPWRVKHRIVHSRSLGAPEVSQILQSDIAQALVELGC